MQKIHDEQNVEGRIQSCTCTPCLTCFTLNLALVPMKLYLQKEIVSPWVVVCCFIY
jgi:hypothetical protein